MEKVKQRIVILFCIFADKYRFCSSILVMRDGILSEVSYSTTVVLFYK